MGRETMVNEVQFEGAWREADFFSFSMYMYSTLAFPHEVYCIKNQPQYSHYIEDFHMCHGLFTIQNISPAYVFSMHG